ncbi:MAG TPA: peptidoglycan endopeptidase [Akkermansia muciniphila]|uniref:peptidoglycan endopeptidase n=1 Tax=Akkermansia sp. TaxID=1872421 RepID=UPI001D77D2C2|nr:peptidoglycan endopeptidase [Akkermansia sp.]MBE5699950.1 peptidoglycan endopeptidase [Akkermansia sp.]HRN23098.1 peptidoglycan endopeptidase [Akkermansia muciniphila]
MTFAAYKTLSVAGALLAGLFLSSCSSQQQVEAPARLPAYHFVPGKTAVLHNGKAIPPRNAPSQVKRAIAAANSLVNKPYRLGGGHRRHHDTHYDCSGSTSFVLKEAGLLTSTRHSRLFLNYGQKGAGDWISIYAKNGHVFMVICGLRFDTTGSGRRGEGPRWRVDGRNTRHFLVRHPTGL